MMNLPERWYQEPAAFKLPVFCCLKLILVLPQCALGNDVYFLLFLVNHLPFLLSVIC